MKARKRWHAACAIAVTVAAVVFVQSSQVQLAQATGTAYNANAPGGSCVSNVTMPSADWGTNSFPVIRAHCLLNTAPGTPVRIRLLVKGYSNDQSRTDPAPYWYNFSYRIDQAVPTMPTVAFGDSPPVWTGLHLPYNGSTVGALAWGNQATSGASGVDPFVDMAANYSGSVNYAKSTDSTNQVETVDTEASILGQYHVGVVLHDEWGFGSSDDQQQNLRQGTHASATASPCTIPFTQSATEVMWGWCDSNSFVQQTLRTGSSLHQDTGDTNTADPPTIIANVCYDVTCSADHLLNLDWQAVDTSGDPVFPSGDPIHVPSDAGPLPDGHASDCKLDAISDSGGVGVALLDWSNQSSIILHFACYYSLDHDAKLGRIVMWPTGHHGAPVFIPVPLDSGNYREPVPAGDTYTTQSTTTEQTGGGYGYVSGLVIFSAIQPNKASFGATCDNTAKFDALDRSFGLFAPCNLDHIFDWSYPVADGGNALTFCANPLASGACNITGITHDDAPVTDPGTTPPATGLGPSGTPGKCAVGPWQYRQRDSGGSFGSWTDVPGTGLDQAHTWDSTKEYEFQSTVSNVASLVLQYGDDVPGEAPHTDTQQSPPDGTVVFGPMQFRRDGAWTVSWSCTGTDGYGVDGLIESGKDGTPYPGGGSGQGGSGSGSLGDCLSKAFGQASSFDLLDPSTWLGSAAAALNPINYGKATLCVLSYVFTPKNGLNVYSQQLSNAYAKSTIASVANIATTPLDGINAFGNAAGTGTCAGPSVNLATGTHGEHVSGNPLSTCTHHEVRDIAYTAETVGVLLGAVLITVRMFSAALGIKPGVVPMPAGSQNEGGPGQGSAGWT